MARKIAFTAATIVACSFGIFSQGNSCPMVVNVFTPMKNIPDGFSLVPSVRATAMNVRTRKVFRSTLRDGLPFFAKLHEDKYQITLAKSGFQTAVNTVVLDCAEVDDGVFVENADIFPGDPNRILRDVHAEVLMGKYKLGVKEPDAVRQNNSTQPVGSNVDEKDSLDLKVVNDSAINFVKPEYPPAARAVKATGEVRVQVTIDTRGNVVSASAISGHPLLYAASVKAARKSKFPRTLLSGRPVNVTGVIVYKFIERR